MNTSYARTGDKWTVTTPYIQATCANGIIAVELARRLQLDDAGNMAEVSVDRQARGIVLTYPPDAELLRCYTPGVDDADADADDASTELPTAPAPVALNSYSYAPAAAGDGGDDSGGGGDGGSTKKSRLIAYLQSVRGQVVTSEQMIRAAGIGTAVRLRATVQRLRRDGYRLSAESGGYRYDGRAGE